MEQHKPCWRGPKALFGRQEVGDFHLIRSTDLAQTQPVTGSNVLIAHYVLYSPASMTPSPTALQHLAGEHSLGLALQAKQCSAAFLRGIYL